MSTVLFIGADHAGFALKEKLRELLSKERSDLRVEDLGCFDEKSVDYPDVAGKVGRSVVGATDALGILVCGSGIGVAIAANKIAGVRAAQVWDSTSARLSKEHNNANIICIGARLTGPEVAFDCVRVWLNSKFVGGRHEGRVQKIHQLEGR